MDKQLKAMIAAQFLVGKMSQGLKPVPGSALVCEAVDIAEAICDEIGARDEEAAAAIAPVVVPPAVP